MDGEAMAPVESLAGAAGMAAGLVVAINGAAAAATVLASGLVADGDGGPSLGPYTEGRNMTIARRT